KICALLAAAECAQELVAQRRLAITRLAGTSAGAIVACLFAADIPMGEVRERLRGLGPGGLRDLFPPLWRWTMYRRFLAGEPFWDTVPLRQLLAEFFDARGLATLGDLREKTGRHVFVTAANITTESRVDYFNDDESVVDSLISSCSLPFVFTAYGTCGNHAIVDGGICENLPIEVLKKDETQWGQVIGISLASDKAAEPPRGLKEFCLALLNTSINNSMMRARESIGAKRVFRIVTHIDTLDFARGLGEGLKKDHYDRIRYEAEKFFATLEMVRQPDGDQELLVGDPWRENDVETMKKLGRIYHAQHESIRLEYSRVQLVVYANSLLPAEHPQHGLPDLIEQTVVFRPHDQPVSCHRLTVGSTSATDFPGRVSCTVRNGRREVRSSEFVPSLSEGAARGPDPVGIKREILVFFNPPLPAGPDADAPFSIFMRDCLRGAMLPLREQGWDILECDVARAAAPVERMDLVLLLPESFPEVKMVADDDLRLGHEMSEGEIGEYYVPPGYRPLGWTARSVPSERCLRVKYLRSPS
ncbi:MAG TPA: patatin-like phospholipase family protein, partial [Thermoanaerobaculia bacterium]|nr:patatin-like phospholipase family protein [Thermoanaerobaculia bacterium]